MQKDFIYENYLKMPDDLEFEQAMKVYEELGYQRKRIGDFACYVSLIYGVFAR